MKKNLSSLNTTVANIEEETKVITLGCRLNYYESDLIANNAKICNQKNTVIINTCAVTNEAERQSKQTIRKMKRLNPYSKIIATGCAVQLKPSEFLKMNEVDQIVGNEHKIKKEIFSKHSSSKKIFSDIMEVTNNDTPIIIIIIIIKMIQFITISIRIIFVIMIIVVIIIQPFHTEWVRTG